MEIELESYNPEQLDKNQKVTIHKTGKMGFTMDAARKLNLAEMKSANIAYNKSNSNDTSLYLLIYQDINEGKFRVSKAGLYYYINTKILFDNLKIDYSNGNITYDMSEEIINNKHVYKLKRREQKEKPTEEA